MGVVAVARRVVGPRHGAVGRRLVVEARDQLARRPASSCVDMPAEITPPSFSTPAGVRPVKCQNASATTGVRPRHALEPAGFRDRRLEQRAAAQGRAPRRSKLRHRPGLVSSTIASPARAQPVDAVGPARQLRTSLPGPCEGISSARGVRPRRRRCRGRAGPPRAARNQSAMRSKRGHQKARTPGRSNAAPKAARPQASSLSLASVGKLSGKAFRKSSSAWWMKVPRSA